MTGNIGSDYNSLGGGTLTYLNPPDRRSLQQLAQVAERPRRQPSTSRLVYPEPHALQGVDRVRIGRDGEPDACLARGMDMNIVQVETVGLGVDFEVASKLACSGNDTLHVDVYRLARPDQAPLFMSH